MQSTALSSYPERIDAILNATNKMISRLADETAVAAGHSTDRGAAIVTFGVIKADREDFDGWGDKPSPEAVEKLCAALYAIVHLHRQEVQGPALLTWRRPVALDIRPDGNEGLRLTCRLRFEPLEETTPCP